MSDPDFVEVAQQLVGTEFGTGDYGAGVYGGTISLLGDNESPQTTAWTEIDE